MEEVKQIKAELMARVETRLKYRDNALQGEVERIRDEPGGSESGQGKTV